MASITPTDVVACILAGGEGGRFRPFTDIIPKPMMHLGPEERPLLEYIVRWLVKYGIRDIVLLVGYRWRQIANYFNDGGRWGVRIRYSRDTEEYSGTGGALLNAYKQGLLGSDPTLVWYGDILAPPDVHALLKTHEATGAHATIAPARTYRVPVGVAETDGEGSIVSLREKPDLPLNVTIGILTLNPNMLGEAEESLGRRFDIMGDLIPWMIQEGFKVKAYTHTGPWYDVGSLERYQKLREEELKEFLTLNPEA
ncbi:MAG: nucleotidyltransferase family protein [Desulfurococcales archaeon]|nr:nucleotidyltransferase family protein [Desulfurococcales archaeon]